MKKIFAAVLSLVTAAVMLTACGSEDSSKDNTGSKKEADTTTTTTAQQNSDVSSDAPTSSEEPTTSSEPDASDEEIIPLFSSDVSEQIHKLTPEEIIKAATFDQIFKPTDTGKVLNVTDTGDPEIFLYTTEYLNRSFVLGSPASQSSATTCTVTFYIMKQNEKLLNVPNEAYSTYYYEIEGGAADRLYLFIPLYYNQTKQCLFGYRRKAGTWSLFELYWDGSYFTSQDVEDPSVYGF